jgi:Asp-tRNA(Asn)/Glu-tRNA(Gln) amidotransferase A subunit family amidase
LYVNTALGGFCYIPKETADDPNTFDALPIGLQIVGRRFEDEKVVAILKYLLQQ